MPLTRLLAAAATVSLLAFAAAAQDPEGSTRAPAEKNRGISDLEATVDALLEEESQPVSSRQDQLTTETSPSADNDAEPPAQRPPARRTVPAPATGAAGTPPPRLTRAEMAEVERIAERGRLLIAIARAGIIATQDMLTRISDPEGAGIAGWIAEPEGNAMAVTFYDRHENGPRIVYRTTVLGGRVVSRDVHIGAERPVLTPLQARMAAARAATESLEQQSCNDQPFNVIVVPPVSASTPIDVYQMTPPARRGVFPLGGHFRSTIGPDGSVAQTRGFTNRCVDVTATPAAPGAQPRPIGVTHLLDPMPTEIHVFLAQLIGQPLLVATGEPQRVWLVTPERITEVRN